MPSWETSSGLTSGLISNMTSNFQLIMVPPPTQKKKIQEIYLIMYIYIY